MNPSGPAPDFAEILAVLARHNVRYVIVGGVGAVLHGAPVNTFDLAIVHRRDDANIDRLLAALQEMEAVHRLQPERNLQPDATHLRSAGHQLLMTKFGPLDLLGSVGWADQLNVPRDRSRRDY